MSDFKRAPAPHRDGILTSLRATELVDSKPVLPAEIISIILNCLPIPDLMRFARTSRRLQEMVYDDTRWVQRLRIMGCWNEAEARSRFEAAMKKRWEAQKAKQEEEAKRLGRGVNGGAAAKSTSTTLFDANIEHERRSRHADNHVGKRNSITDGFETLSLSASPTAARGGIQRPSLQDPAALLTVFSNVKSIRGAARQEYARVYAALAPFYLDLARSRNHTDPAIFRVYREPEQQAQMLAQLQTFAKSDWADGWRQREEKLGTMIGIFENAVLREFEQGNESWDVDGRMRRYAHVLDVLNGGQAAVELFISKHSLFTDRIRLGNPMDCITQASAGTVVLQPSQEFFESLSKNINAQGSIIERVFPPHLKVLHSFIEKVGEDIIAEYVTPLFDEAHERSVPSYLKAVAGVFEQSIQFGSSLNPVQESEEDFRKEINEVLGRVFEPHVDLYLQDELDFFKRDAESQVSVWEKKLSAEDASTESFFMANVNRQADKKDFLSSFKKVVMMPVDLLPSLPLSSPFASSKPAAPSATLQVTTTSNPSLSPMPSRPDTPVTPGFGQLTNSSSTTANPEGPTTELAAKAALMASRLEGIKSLFSIEVALNLVHSAKSSLERAAYFVQLGGQTGEEAREQCQMIFVSLIQILGDRHVKSGFDKAVDHLSKYNPREVSEHSKGEVAPLVTFLELVNVGDLISQMVDMFYEQQLVAAKLADKMDFLDPTVKAKKKFEQMLDERVAAGLNKGIDVLMEEVEYVCATTQLVADFNPPPRLPGQIQDIDIGPTNAAQKVVEIVSNHTNMLKGSTDKHMLDVFNQEVGLRLFGVLCKHLKRQRVSTDGAIKLISDMNLYFGYIQTLRNQDLLLYFKALRELSQIYLIDPSHAKEMATIIADGDRFNGIFRAEEVYEFAERRADWFQVKKDVERAMYGFGCVTM